MIGWIGTLIYPIYNILASLIIYITVRYNTYTPKPIFTSDAAWTVDSGYLYVVAHSILEFKSIEVLLCLVSGKANSHHRQIHFPFGLCKTY